MVNRYCVHVRKSGAGSRPPDRERSEGKLHSRRRRSLFRHAGLAQAGEIRGFEDGLGLRLSCNHGPQSADARIAIVAAQSAGFGEFCGGAFGLSPSRAWAEASQAWGCGPCIGFAPRAFSSQKTAWSARASISCALPIAEYQEPTSELRDRTCRFAASGSRTRRHAFTHDGPRPSCVSRTSRKCP